MVANRFDQLIDEWDPIIRKAFLDSIYRIRDAAQIEAIARLLQNGDIEGAMRAVGMDPVLMRQFDKALASAFEAGGLATATALPVARVDGLRVVFQFNVRNPLAERWLREYSSTLIREIIDDQRVMIRQYFTDAMARGLNPRSAALDLVGRIGPNGVRIGGTIGLTASQEAWVRAYADALASRNPLDALTRTLRDKRFDKSVRRFASRGESIPAELRESMVRAYRNRALRYRAETIARTEALRSLHEAQQQAMEQAISSGAIDGQNVSFIWRTARDLRVRDSHQAMEAQKVKMGERFVTGAGNLLEYPGDPAGNISEVINCRCWREPRIDFLAGVR